jgi:hypothetical protein
VRLHEVTLSDRVATNQESFESLSSTFKFSHVDAMKGLVFDFTKFLHDLDPCQSYRVEKLTGGHVNLTVRATKQNVESVHAGPFAGHKSLVLKYAPPYIADVGETAPFSQDRQVQMLVVV